MTLDLEASYFPDPGGDDFGVPWGFHRAYAWNVEPADLDSRQRHL